MRTVVNTIWSALHAAVTATHEGNAYDTTKLAGGVYHAFTLNVTAAATESGDKLDVKIQESNDNVTWTDLGVAFTQVAGDASEPVQETKHYAGCIAKYVRAYAAVIDAGTANASFTFTVTDAVVVGK